MSALAGYSGRPLARKLGIVAGSRAAFVAAPAGFAGSFELPPGVRLRVEARGPVEVVVFFVTRERELAKRFPRLARVVVPDGGLWIAWPKRTSGVATDLNENAVRAVGLGCGLVDNKVCAIDDVWSGLRFVARVSDRPAR